MVHSTKQYENNRAKVSHHPKRQRDRQMRFTSVAHARQFSRYTDSCRISSESADICCGQPTTVCFGHGRSPTGMR